MNNQSTTSSGSNPYATVLFTPTSVTNQVQQIIDSTLEELQEVNAKKSKKNHDYTLSNYISSFLKQTDYNKDTLDKAQTEEPKDQISSFSPISRFDDNSNSSQRSVKLINPINPGPNLIRPASAPPIHRELPSAPDPSHIIKTPPERYLLPPFLWAKIAKQASTSSDYEDVQQAPPPPVHRRRGRPRKNPLPDDLYSNNHHNNSTLVRYHSAQVNIHNSNSATFYSNSSNNTTASSTKNTKKSKTVESSTFSETSPKETAESTTVKSEKSSNIILENTEDNSTSSTNTTPVRSTSSEISIKNDQPQKFKPKESVSSSETNNESESDIEPDELVTISEDRPPKPPETVFPESDIDDICASKSKNSEYLVKFRGKAYKDTEWISKDKLMKNPDLAPTVLSFEQFGINTQEPYFNPLFLIPEKILDFRDNLYLIKWSGLGYKYSTWEALDDLNITKTNLNNLIEKFESIQNQPKIANDIDITYQPINVYDQFSLDEMQADVVDRLYKKFCNKSDTNLYGTIGSILRLEIGALISALKDRLSFFGPYLLVVAPPILKLASCEMATYTNLAVLTIPDNDEEELYYIKKNAFLFENSETPKFNIVVVSSTNFQRFTNEFPQLNYVVAAVDNSEIVEQPLPNIHTVKAMMRITVKKRTGKEDVMDSQDDSTFLHSEFTIFSPMLKSQRALYQQTIRDNIDILTTPANKVDKSRLYEVVMKLCSLANSPACLNSQEIVFKMANPMMKKKRFEDSGKMRVLKELIHYAQSTNKRLMVMCRDSVVLDTLQLYVTAYEIPYVHVGTLGLKRRKLDDFSPEAKVNKNIIVLAQIGKQPINWLPLMLDIIVVFDGVYNPMYYFSHAARKPRKRDCIVIRLLAEDSHEAYLASCADHYEELPMSDIFKAAAETFMRPARELVVTNSRYLKNVRYDVLFNSSQTSFQYIFDEDKSAKVSASDSKKNIEFENNNTNSDQRKKASSLPKSISSSSSTTNFLDKVNVQSSSSPSKAPLFPPLSKSAKKVNEIDSSTLVKRPEINSSKSVPDLIQKESSFHSSPQHPKSIITKLEPKSSKSDSTDISGDDIEDSDDQPSTVTNVNNNGIIANDNNNNLNSLQNKKSKVVQISPSPQIQDNSNLVKIEKQQDNKFIPNAGISASNSSTSIDKKFPSSAPSLIKSVESEPNLLHFQMANNNSKHKRILKRKIRLEPGQPIPPKPEHGTITIHHHHKRINASLSSASSIQIHPTSSKDMKLSKVASTPYPLKSSITMNSSEFIYKFAEIPKVVDIKNDHNSQKKWIIDDLELLLLLVSNHPFGQWGLICNIMKRRYTLMSIREAAFKLIKILLDRYESDNSTNSSEFPLLHLVINDHEQINKKNGKENNDYGFDADMLHEIASKNKIGRNSVRYRLLKISLMLIVSVIMAASSNPPSDIFVASPKPITLPAPWWSQNDDKQLIYYIWQNGYSLFACQANIWSNKTAVRPDLLVVRFEALMKEIESEIISKKSLIFPLVLREHQVTMFNPEQIEAAFNSPIGQVINDFGFIEIEGISKLSGQSFDQSINNSIRLTQSINIAVIADFFERIRYELLSPQYYFTEDYQFMEAVEFHGRNHSSQSLLIQSIFENQPSFDFNNIIKNVKRIFENKRFEAVSHINTSFNTVGDYVPVMPFTLSERLIINNLGVISHKSGFHNEKYIYPVGYEAVTTFASTFTPNETDKYLCQIIDNGMDNPIFKVTSMSNKTVFQDVSPEKVWQQICDKISYINSMNMFESIKTPGHELYGLSFPTTIRLIQSMKGCDQCMKYRIRAFKVPFENIKH